MKCDICTGMGFKNIYKCPSCGINYCSLKCYKKPVHIDCVEEFKKKDLKKLLKTDGNNTDIIRDYEDVCKNLKNVNINCEVAQDITQTLSQPETNGVYSFGESQKYWDRMNESQKDSFFDFINELKSKKHEKSELLCPWWIIMTTDMMKKKIVEVNEEKQKLKNNDVVPSLYTRLNLLSLETFSVKSSSEYNENLAFMIHRLLLCYIVIVRIYGNRNVNETSVSIQEYDKSMKKYLCLFAPFLSGSSKFGCNSYEKLIENFEVDVLLCFKDLWNYSCFTLSEQFFVEIYRDYLILLNEVSNEELHGNSCQLYFYSLSEIYYCFKRNIESRSEKLICKKLLFFISWCLKYSDNPHFLNIVNFLQYRSEYLKSIIKTQLSDDEVVRKSNDKVSLVDIDIKN